MNILVIGSSPRTVGNFWPLVAEMHAQGHDIACCHIPVGPRATTDAFVALGGQAKLVAPSSGAAGLAIEHPFWGSLVELVLDRQVDCVLCDDMNHWPAKRAAKCLSNLPVRPAFLSFQHGLYQSWSTMNRDFSADAFLCFGSRHVFNFESRYWGRVLPVGLPKLDRLALVPRIDDGGILFVAQSSPNPAILRPLLADLQSKTGKEVYIRAHPGHPEMFDELRGDFSFLPVDKDPVDQMASCSWMLTTHSTATLEAVMLGKHVVLLPSFGIGDFQGYPGIATDLTADKVISALVRLRKSGELLDEFMRRVGGRSGRKSTPRAASVVTEWVRRHKAGELAHPWWIGCNPIRDAVAGNHPYCDQEVWKALGLKFENAHLLGQ
jgi:hypothetical protein